MSRTLGVCGIGGAVMLGWLTGTVVLAELFPSFASAARTMPPFLLVGLAVTLLGDERPSRARRLAVRMLAAMVAVIGLVGLFTPELERLSARALLLEPLGTASMTSPAAACLVMIGAALGVRDLELGLSMARLRSALVLVPALGALALLVAHLYGVPAVALPPGDYACAVSTSTGIILSCLAILFARPTSTLMRLVLSDDSAGSYLRRTLPAVVFIPIALGALRIAGERAGHYDGGTGPALHALAEIVCLSAIVFWNARSLFRSEGAQRASIERLGESEEELQATFDCIGEGVIATDAGGRVIRMSRAAERATGRTLRECSGKRLDVLFRMLDLDTGLPVESPFDHVSRTGSAVGLPARTVVVGPNGAHRALLRSGAPILSKLGILRGVVLVLDDVQQHRVTRTRGR
jgi:two-component system, cell cycle sensor histidine kinase and response regulator CckA